MVYPSSWLNLSSISPKLWKCVKVCCIDCSVPVIPLGKTCLPFQSTTQNLPDVALERAFPDEEEKFTGVLICALIWLCPSSLLLPQCTLYPSGDWKISSLDVLSLALRLKKKKKWNRKTLTFWLIKVSDPVTVYNTGSLPFSYLSLITNVYMSIFSSVGGIFFSKDV